MEWNRLCPSSRDADSRQIEEQLDGRMKSGTVQNELNDNTRKLDILWDFGEFLARLPACGQAAAGPYPAGNKEVGTRSDPCCISSPRVYGEQALGNPSEAGAKSSGRLRPRCGAFVWRRPP